ncbi:hypothetical protein SAMN05421776_1175 [Nocardia farcinica]|uniref:Uncharacterized protein n=1 Tax=Nocardia farcinica TaxID=37329 RepID=A0A0H5NVN3_NOCFR|nr:hypothetical protein [Nocardia farcinica]PFW99012.1 hypothetical protein CJ469_05612 [Nocardia farcinica]PFX06050.1 hypothetical protein CJ468_04910 [Nocardia farcinica]CRY79860.1 Uncharacterised protein [Nocardia farcinica]SIT33566.1 hypothetical protein SAMN05421776_1175 [Nocardia farcinica]
MDKIEVRHLLEVLSGWGDDLAIGIDYGKVVVTDRLAMVTSGVKVVADRSKVVSDLIAAEWDHAAVLMMLNDKAAGA